MNEKQRLLTVLEGKTPDRVPWYADLGHWYRAESGQAWNLYTINNATPEMVALHRDVKAGLYIEVGTLHEEHYDGSISRERLIKDDQAIEHFHTPKGTLTMIRRWNPISFSWDMVKHLIDKPDDLRILIDAQEHKYFKPRNDLWPKLEALIGDAGLGFPSFGYTGLGSLISYYMGVEKTIYALEDEPELVHRYINIYNARQLELVTLYAQSPAPHMIFGDNLSSDVQSPRLFRQISFNHYQNIASRLHQAGKTVSAHIDGRMNGLLSLLAEAGIDVADACTPKPNGDLSPADIRQQAGSRMVIMGGIAPTLWLPETPEKVFIEHVKAWLGLRHISTRLVQSAGDQVPPGTKLQRIRLVNDLVESYGRY